MLSTTTASQGLPRVGIDRGREREGDGSGAGRSLATDWPKNVVMNGVADDNGSQGGGRGWDQTKSLIEEKLFGQLASPEEACQLQKRP